MVRRRVAELWRLADAEIDPRRSEWEGLYRELEGEVISVLSDSSLTIDVLRGRLTSLLDLQRKRRPPRRAELVRGRLIDGVRAVRELLKQLVDLPWRSTPDHPVTDAMATLNRLYGEDFHSLPLGFTARLGRVWQGPIEGPDRERAFQALEVATLLNLRRALRNGTVWVEHSLTFRSRERLFFPSEHWKHKRYLYYQRLALPMYASAFLDSLVERAEEGVAAVAKAAAKGGLRVDDDLHLTPLAAEEQDPQVAKLRDDLSDQIGEAQLPEIILDVDAQVRFSWIMLGREPRSSNELLMVYSGMLAHGTAMSAADTARMMPQVSCDNVRQAMRWASDEGRLAAARSAVVHFMQRHPIADSWGRSDLASSDMMSLETSRKVWQARVDPRRHTPAVGMYSHVRAFWGISHAQPIVLNERQAGAAIEGVVRDDRLETSQLAVDTHGYTDFAMALAKLLGFDLCPRLKALKERHLFLPVGARIPESLRTICRANIDVRKIDAQWDDLVHLAASVHSGNASAINTLNRFGSASRGNPLYEAGVHLGRLLRTVFLADYFVVEAFRRELLRVLNRGESVNALKRAIYAGRVAQFQAKRNEEMQAVADALSLLANIVMAWNTARMQRVVDIWKLQRGYVVPSELMGKVAPTRTEGINLRGVFRFPIELYADQLLPRASKTRAAES
jgi:TnpA family transposase